MQTVLKTRAERVPTRGAGELPLLKAVKGAILTPETSGVWRMSVKFNLRAAAALAFACVALSAAAQALTQSDINQIVEAARYNTPRYERDYKGRTFIGIGTFVGINLSSRNISVAFDNSLGCRERASCGSTPPMAYCSDHGLKS